MAKRSKFAPQARARRSGESSFTNRVGGNTLPRRLAAADGSASRSTECHFQFRHLCWLGSSGVWVRVAYQRPKWHGANSNAVV